MNDRETRCYSGEVRAEQRTDEPTPHSGLWLGVQQPF
ncbi:peptidase [Klebsiella pneumoniae]|uniref:Peptidase n=1 Tax=Klebsiella pneumoniae TaxID=573 RepID=A0A3S4H2Z4_KLEPN|nr:peptidase [Klebsiella pneumoniae]